ncbi:hypothetical protein [Nocardia sp. NPDC049707]|uniref:hypothetical protein n=1 Tax=Nocardia sp. NPDC049707 TaxID=3154735 RepID=UPI00341BB23A
MSDPLGRVTQCVPDPFFMSKYLAVYGWQLETRDRDIKEIWRLPYPGGLLGRIMLPLATDYVDFPGRFRDTLVALATIYDSDPAQLAERIIAVRGCPPGCRG